MLEENLFWSFRDFEKRHMSTVKNDLSGVNVAKATQEKFVNLDWELP